MSKPGEGSTFYFELPASSGFTEMPEIKHVHVNG
jgi:hypothetical protein